MLIYTYALVASGRLDLIPIAVGFWGRDQRLDETVG
jgi:hypothetical protein